MAKKLKCLSSINTTNSGTNNSSSSGIGFNVGIPVGFGGAGNMDMSFSANLGNTNIGLNYANNSHEVAGVTKATIGDGLVNVNTTIVRDDVTGEVRSVIGGELINADLNRDITNVQEITKDTTSGGYDIDLNINLSVAASAGNLFSSEGRDYLSNQAKENLGGTVKLYYEVTPMGVNESIEATRGSEQSWAIGDAAVYKSGDEPNGVRDSYANNVGQQNIPTKPDGSVDWSKVGEPVDFGSGLKGVLSWTISSKEGGLVSQTCNYGLPGCNDMSLTHDPLANYLARNYPAISTLITNQSTIPFAYIYNTYGLIGKPINTFIDYLQTPAHTINLPSIEIPVPTINQTFQQQ